MRSPIQHGVAGVVAALIAGHDVEALGEQVDDFAFAFVAPLRAKNEILLMCFWTESSIVSTEVVKRAEARVQTRTARSTRWS